MLTLPRIIERAPRPYLAIAVATSMAEMSIMAPRAIKLLKERMAARQVASSGALFFKYDLIRMPDRLELEVGSPTAKRFQSDETLRAGILPAGRYATTTYRGPYDDLYDVNAVLIGWAKERGLRWDVDVTPDGDRFGCRLETYLTDPAITPDPKDWETELSIRLAD